MDAFGVRDLGVVRDSLVACLRDVKIAPPAGMGHRRDGVSLQPRGNYYLTSRRNIALRLVQSEPMGFNALRRSGGFDQREKESSRDATEGRTIARAGRTRPRAHASRPIDDLRTLFERRQFFLQR